MIYNGFIVEKIYESIIKFTEKSRTLPGLIINLECHLGRSYSEMSSVRSGIPNANRIPAVKDPHPPTALPGAAPAAGVITPRGLTPPRGPGLCRQGHGVTAFFRGCLHSSAGAQCLKYFCCFLCS